MIQVVFLFISSHSQALQRSSFLFITNTALDSMLYLAVLPAVQYLSCWTCRFLLLRRKQHPPSTSATC